MHATYSNVRSGGSIISFFSLNDYVVPFLQTHVMSAVHNTKQISVTEVLLVMYCTFMISSYRSINTTGFEVPFLGEQLIYYQNILLKTLHVL